MGYPDAMPQAAMSARARVVCTNLMDPSEYYGSHNAGGLQYLHCSHPAARSPKERYAFT